MWLMRLYVLYEIMNESPKIACDDNNNEEQLIDDLFNTYLYVKVNSKQKVNHTIIVQVHLNIKNLCNLSYVYIIVIISIITQFICIRLFSISKRFLYTKSADF